MANPLHQRRIARSLSSRDGQILLNIGQVAFDMPVCPHLPALYLRCPFLLCSRQTIRSYTCSIKIVLQPIVQLAAWLIPDGIEIVLKDIRIMDTFLLRMFAQPPDDKATDSLSSLLLFCRLGSIYPRFITMLQEPACLVVTGWFRNLAQQLIKVMRLHLA